MVLESPISRGYLDTSPFWEGARTHRLMLQLCRDTGRFQHPPQPVSQYSGSRNLEWRQACGKGRIFSWIIQSASRAPLLPRSPLVSVLVDLEEDVRILSWLTAVENQEVRRGRTVELDWQPLDDGRIWPAFRIV
jgi:uncharacterized OB-fold protein